ncbi:MAG TPA: hypothetical protein VH914_00475 [Acidimicrobiia bacterium]|nr:hypothetical protein [Acidimicrobiia bacterium]
MNPRRAARLRATTACLVVAIGAGGLPLVAGGAPVRPQLTLAALALAALGVGLTGWSPGVTVAAIAFAAEYGLRLHERDAVDALVAAEAVLLFATVELGLRALEARSFARREPAVRKAAIVGFAGLLVGAGASAFVVLLLGNQPLPAPTAGLALGLVATVGVVVAAEVVRRRVSRS